MILMREQDADDVIAAIDWAIGFMDEHKPSGEADALAHQNYEELHGSLKELSDRFNTMLKESAEPAMVECQNCVNGEWYAECCNGSRGCSCRGQEVAMGRCRVCGGTGYHKADANTSANWQSIQGRAYLGSGPT